MFPCIERKIREISVFGQRAVCFDSSEEMLWFTTWWETVSTSLSSKPPHSHESKRSAGLTAGSMFGWTRDSAFSFTAESQTRSSVSNLRTRDVFILTPSCQWTQSNWIRTAIKRHLPVQILSATHHNNIHRNKNLNQNMTKWATREHKDA